MEPLSKSASERLESYERELRDHLKELAPVERDEALRELRAHVLEAVESGRQVGKSDDEITRDVLNGFGSPSEYAHEYLSVPKDETPKLGIIDKVILFTVKGAAKLWVAFILGFVYFTLFFSVFTMSLGGIIGGLFAIVFDAGLLPEGYLGIEVGPGISAFGGFLIVLMGVAGFYLATRLLIKVVRFHYYYRSSPKKLFAYLKESKGKRFWTLWRVIDITAVLTILVSFMIGFLNQSLISTPGQIKKIKPVTQRSHVAKLSAKQANMTLKAVGDVSLKTDNPNEGVPPSNIARFKSTYNYNVLRPVLDIKRRGEQVNIYYAPKGSGKMSGSSTLFQGSFPLGEDHILKGNKHNILLSTAVKWDLNLQFLKEDADLNLAGLDIGDLEIKILGSGDSKIRFKEEGKANSAGGSLKLFSISNVSPGKTDIDFEGLANKKPSKIEIKSSGSSLNLQNIGDANPDDFTLSNLGDDVALNFSGAWNKGEKRIDIKVTGGNLTLDIPKNLPVKLDVKGLPGMKLKLFDLTAKAMGSMRYETPGFSNANKRLDITIKAQSDNIDINQIKR